MLQHELREFSQKNSEKDSQIAELEVKNAELTTKQDELSERVEELLEANSRLETRFDDAQTVCKLPKWYILPLLPPTIFFRKQVHCFDG